MNYYEHHIGDYDANTAHLSWAEDMAYTRLMRLYYRKEAPIPASVNDACRLVRALSKDQKQAVESVLSEFFELRDDGWHQARCDSEISAYQKKVEHNQRVGKLGGRPRKTQTQNEPEENPMGYFREPESNPPQTPDPRPQTYTAKAVVSSASDSADARPTPGDVCKAMRSAGMGIVNPSSPKLVDAIDSGVTVAEFAQAATDSVVIGKGFSYALSMAEGRRADAKRAPKTATQPESFAERDERKARERYLEATGQTEPAMQHMGDVIDISPMRISQ